MPAIPPGVGGAEEAEWQKEKKAKETGVRAAVHGEVTCGLVKGDRTKRVGFVTGGVALVMKQLTGQVRRFLSGIRQVEEKLAQELRSVLQLGAAPDTTAL